MLMSGPEKLGQSMPVGGSSGQSEDTVSVNLRALFLTLWRGKWRLGLVTLAAVLCAAAYAFWWATPKYLATATVILETREENVVDLGGVLSGLSGDTVVVNSEVEVLRSGALLTRVAKELNLAADPEFNTALQPVSPTKERLGDLRNWAATRLGLPSPEPVSADLGDATMVRTVNQLRRSLSIRNLPQSVVFEISVLTTSPTKSARIANAIADLYVLEQLEVKFEATEQATGWLSDRVSELRDDLEAKQERLARHVAETDLINAASLEALTGQLEEMRVRIAEEEAALVRARARVEALESAPDDVSSRAILVDDRTLTRLAARLDADPGNKTLRAAFDQRYGQVRVDAKNQVKRGESQLAALRASGPSLTSQIDDQSAKLAVKEEIEREVEASALIYEYFLNRLKETSVQQGIQQSDSRVLSRAQVPLVPAEPRQMLLLAVAMILGVAGGSAFLVLREGLQSTFRTANDLEWETGFSVLGQIPVMPVGRRMAVFDYLRDKPTSAAVEAVRNLRTSVLFSSLENPPKIIMTTSSLPGEGKTTQSIALAQNLAGMGRKVILVEGDIRRRVLAGYFDIPQRRGLISAVAEPEKLEAAIHTDPKIGFDVLVGEQTQINAADLFSSSKFKALMARLADRYDNVVIDTPPVLSVPDARLIGQHADAVLYTVRWDKTRRSNVAEGLRLLETVGIRVTGLVLSQVNPKGMARYGDRGSFESYQSSQRAYYTS